MSLIRRRIGLLFALFLVLFAAATARAMWLGTVQAGTLKQRALSQQVENLDVPARRGTITDRNGRELAVSEDAVTVFANPFLIKDPARVAARIAHLIGISERELVPLLSDRKKGFVYLRRKLDAARGHRIAKLGIEGIDTVAEPRRVYPQGVLASQLIGSVGTDNVGLSGVEQAYEKDLHGTDGKRRLVKDALGEPVSVVDSERSSSGEDMRLTIDSALQERVEQVLGEVGTTFHPKGATALVLDPRTGQLLALANWPGVDANDPGEASAYERSDRAVSAAYEPGSTFKPFTVSGALEEKLIEPSTSFDLPPTLRVADREIKEAHERGYEKLSVADILAQSSNVGAVKVGLRLGERRFDRWVRRFGFGKASGIGLPGESPGIVPHTKDYSGSSMGNLPIGQGLAVTPLQMAAAYSAIASGGVIHKPYVVAGEGSDGHRVMSRRGADQVSTMLEGVFGPLGTAPEAHVDGYRLAGKTGTAQKPDETGGYSKDRFVASFAGFAPAKNPRLLVSVVVDEPNGGYYGAEVAAPAFEKIVDFALPYLRIPPR